MQTALIISGIGMGLVFVAILFLWAMMELLVRLTPDRARSSAEEISTGSDLPVSTPIDKKRIAAVAVAAAINLRRKQAAAKAVEIALAEKCTTQGEIENRPTTSNWQAVMRSVQRDDRIRLFSRKPRGRSS